MSDKTLFTIGYEGAVLRDFLATLSHCDIKRLIDVRELPLSRRQGFSKRALAEALASHGISYVHLKSLGDPKAGRDAARRGDFASFRKIYNRQLKSPDAQAALHAAAQVAAAGTSCLLCFERDFENCHRSIVAKALSREFGFIIKHIGVRAGATSRIRKYADVEREFALG